MLRAIFTPVVWLVLSILPIATHSQGSQSNPFEPFDCPQSGDTANNLCLYSGDFEVEIHWFHNGQQKIVNLTEWSDFGGIGYFFSRENPEVMVKVLDGCSINGHYWVFLSGLTDQRVRTEVFDHRANVSRRYESTGGLTFQPVMDQAAFPCEF